MAQTSGAVSGAVPTAAPDAQADTSAVQPKFIWGLLLNYAVSKVMGLLGQWLNSKLTTDLGDQTLFDRILRNSSQVAVVLLTGNLPAGSWSTGIGVLDNTSFVEPKSALQIKPDGQPNYQGAHIAIVRFDRDGRPLGFAPLSGGFRTGERFRLKVLSTFDALMVIDNLPPGGGQRQIYPARVDQALSLKGGVEVFVPSGPDEYFEFSGSSGKEQLRITLRDARAFGDAISREPVTREDDGTGARFAQEVGPGRFPVISQSIALDHRR